MRDATDWHPDEHELAACDAGALPDAPWAAIEEHVARCAACCRRLEQLPADPISAMVRDCGAQTADSTPAPAADTTGTLGAPAELLQHPRYRILELLGAGGMGVVFKAEHRLMNRTVALKIVHRRLLSRPAALAQFGEEVRAAARLSHPHIVAAYDAEQAGDVHFLVMEYVAGASLDRVVAECGPLPLTEACTYIRQAALGLQHAFEHGMVHRDIKPQNLMLVDPRLRVSGSAWPSANPQAGDAIVKILDFGLARIAYDAPSAADRAGDVDRPRPAQVTGTPDYIAPEQVTAPHRADTRADIYSLGCTFFYLLTGRTPFPAATPEATIAAHLHQPAPAIQALRPDVPAGLAAALERMLAKDRAQRYQTPAEVARALEPYTTDAARSAPRRRRWHWAALAAVALIVATIVIGMRLRPGGPAEADSRAVIAPPTQSKRALQADRPAPPPAPAARPELAPKADVHQQLVQWLKENNAFRPDHILVGREGDRVGKLLAKGRRVELSIGAGLVKSGKTTLLTTRGGQLFIREYSDAQALALGLAAKGTRLIDVPDHRNPVRAPPDVELADLRIDQADAIAPSQRVTGTVAYRLLGARAEHYALRLHRVPGTKGLSTYHYVKGGIPQQSGSLSFSFGPFDNSGSAKATAVPMFVDLLAIDDPRRPDQGTVVSNTLITLVTVAPKPPDDR